MASTRGETPLKMPPTMTPAASVGQSAASVWRSGALSTVVVACCPVAPCAGGSTTVAISAFPPRSRRRSPS
jgi:hypothetical protein